jgi:3-hydroxyacyl-CoA dehydrogenase
VSPSEPIHTAAVGGGLIGRSWAILFLAAGHSVAVFDPARAASGLSEHGVHHFHVLVLEASRALVGLDQPEGADRVTV